MKDCFYFTFQTNERYPMGITFWIVVSIIGGTLTLRKLEWCVIYGLKARAKATQAEKGFKIIMGIGRERQPYRFVNQTIYY